MPRLLLAGGGHAHIGVLRHARVGTRPPDRRVLINPSRWFVYSGMVPGVLAGHYALEECRIDLQALCDTAGVVFIEGRIVHLDLHAGSVVLADGQQVSFDVLSLDVGSTPDLHALEGASVHALAVRPLGPIVTRLHAWLASTDNDERLLRQLVIVGGGAGGAELAMAVAHALSTTGSRHSLVTLITDQLLFSHTLAVRRRVARALERAGVRLVLETRVTRIDAGRVVCATGTTVEADLVVCATGAVAPSWLRASGLATDEAGCVLVERTLQSRSHRAVFAAGDAATLAAGPVPKAGVFAVRQGPVLARNLEATLRGTALVPYEPQRRWLSLISLGERRAIGAYGGLAWEGAWVWWWKNYIDRRFVQRS